MTPAAIEEKRNAGLLIEAANGLGFYLASTQATSSEDLDREDERKAEAEAKRQDQGEKRATAEKEAVFVSPQTKPESIEAMRNTLKTGVVVVSAPQLFPTPPKLAARMVELAGIEAGQQVLEPSAGTGVLCAAIQAAEPAAKIFAVEINRRLCDLLSEKITPQQDATGGICRNILQGDFLEFSGLGKFDRIVMNPPFADGDDIKHITHALHLLSPGGRIVALCANGPRQNAKLPHHRGDGRRVGGATSQHLRSRRNQRPHRTPLSNSAIPSKQHGP